MRAIGYALLVMASLYTLSCTKMDFAGESRQEISALEGEVETLESRLAEQQGMSSELQTAVEVLRKENGILVEEREGLTQITLDGAANFSTARAELTGDGKAAVDVVWNDLRDYRDRWILIEGHADSRPINDNFKWKYKSNWELSSARAHAVLHYLLDEYKIDPARVRVVGCGEYDPIGDNTTPEGQAKNRRVVITVGTRLDIQKSASL